MNGGIVDAIENPDIADGDKTAAREPESSGWLDSGTRCSALQTLPVLR
jgi:hypothetical protein